MYYYWFDDGLPEGSEAPSWIRIGELWIAWKKFYMETWGEKINEEMNKTFNPDGSPIPLPPPMPIPVY